MVAKENPAPILDRNIVSEYTRRTKIEYKVFNLESLKNFFTILNDINEKIINIEIKKVKEQNYDNENDLINIIKDSLKIDYRISKNNDHAISGLISPNFNIPEDFDDVSMIYISNFHRFNAQIGRRPYVFFEIFLDFRRPSLAINFLSLPSNPTSNESYIDFSGQVEEQVLAQHQRVIEFFGNKNTKLKFIHKRGVYDLFLWTLFYPMAFYLLYKMEKMFNISIENKSTILTIALYLYTIVIMANIGRMFFQYSRWLYPPMEFIANSEKRNIIHRSTFYIVIIGLFVAFFMI